MTPLIVRLKIKELQDGSLRENNLTEGSKVILIPNVETGLLVTTITDIDMFINFVPAFHHASGILNLPNVCNA
uniref:Uncharacterized protein n=1 Tax=Glossina palpalis gambiensis TaxID=67801 RepID=A0A1B0BQS4_9MUSC